MACLLLAVVNVLLRTQGKNRDGAAKVVALPRMGGLHHRYEWHSAA